MDQSLRKVVVSSMVEVDAAFHHHDQELIQVHVDDRISLVNAIQMNELVLAGISAVDAFQLFNLEVLA